MKRFALLAVVVLAGVAVGAPQTPLPAVALGPMQKYAAAVVVADTERARTVEKARVTLVGDLKSAQKSALERGDVDGATAVAELARSYGSSDAETFAGMVVGASDRQYRIRLNPDGTITHSDPKLSGRWAIIGERTVAVLFSNGYVDVWKIDGSGKAFKAVAYKMESEYAATVVR